MDKPSHPFTHYASPASYIHECLSPLILVSSTQDIDAIFASHGINTLADYLIPFGSTMMSKSVVVRDTGGNQHTLDAFPLRFTSIQQYSDMLKGSNTSIGGTIPDADSATLLGLQILSNETVNLSAVQEGKDEENPDSLRPMARNFLPPDTNLERATPWFSEFRNVICRNYPVAEHETFNHPIGCILACTTTNPDPVQAFSSLYANLTLTGLWVDPTMARVQFLIWDVSGPTSEEEAQNLLQKVRKTAGTQCYLLTINSNSSSPGVPDLWTPYIDHETLIAQAIHPEATPHSSPRIQQALLSPSTPTTPRPASPGSRPASPRSSLSSPPTSNVTTLNLFGNNRMMGDWRDQFEETGNEWGRVLHAKSTPMTPMPIPTPSGPRGSKLCAADIQSTIIAVRDMTLQVLIPWMERTIAHLNEQVANARRGWGGRLVGFGRKYFSASPTPPTTTGTVGLVVHPVGSADYQMRRLCDLLFQVHDYKLALLTYDTIKRDFSAQPNTARYYAGVQEMIGITHVLGELPAPASRTGHWEASLTSYRDTGSISLHSNYPWGLRAGLLLYEAYKAKNHGGEACVVLNRILAPDAYVGAEERLGLRNAFILEQLAMSHLLVRSHGVRDGMRRKFAFYMVLSGWLYARHGFHKHGLALLKQALPQYQKKRSLDGFLLVEQQLDSMVALSAYSTEDIDSSLLHLKRLLAATSDSRNAASMQEQGEWIRALLHVWRMSSSPPLDLTVPLIESVHASLLPPTRETNDSGTVVEWNAFLDQIWDDMERELVEEGFNRRGSRMVLRGGVKTLCAVGEPIFIHFSMKNQLAVPILLTNITLECELQSDSENIVASTMAAESVRPFSHGKCQRTVFAKFDVEKILEVGLEGGQTKSTYICITPKTTGTLTIKNLVFQLFDTIPVNHHLPNMMVTVTHPMSQLQVSLGEIPTILASGEVCSTTLELTNVGNRAASKVLLLLSHPNFFSFSPDIDDIVQNDVGDDSIVELTLSKPIAPSSSASFPILLRGDKIGKHVIRILFGYQSESIGKGDSYRIVQKEIHLEVYPSLRISAFTRASAINLNEFIVGVELENVTTEEIFLDKLMAYSPSWKLEACTDDKNVVIQPKQTLYLYSKLLKQNIPVKHDPDRFTSQALEGWMLDGKTLVEKPLITLNTSQVVYSDTPCDDWKQLRMQSRRNWRRTNVLGQFPSIPKDVAQKVFTNYLLDDVDLTLYWHMGSRKGVHCIFGIHLGVATSLLDPKHLKSGNFLFEQTKREQNQLISSLKSRKDVSPVRLVVTFPDDAIMSPDGLCVVEGNVYLLNCSWASSMSYQLDLTSDADWSWLGQTCQLGQLEARQETNLVIKACFSKPGVYNLNRWKLTTSGEDGTFIQTPSVQCLVHVK